MMVKKLFVEIAISPDHDDHHDQFVDQLTALVHGIAGRYSNGKVDVRMFGDQVSSQSRGTITKYRVGELVFEISVDRSNLDFIERCLTFIVTHADDETFNLRKLASMLNLSKPTFYRKIKSLTGNSARDFIIGIKMQIAFQLLQTGNYTVNEAAWECGYTSARHFSKVFYEVFCIYPSKVDSVLNSFKTKTTS
jgi:AraC-like DNA-binding protein